MSTLVRRYRVSRIGTVAARAFDRGRSGSVIAVFTRSFYVSLDGMLACIGDAGLCPGPLNIITSVSAAGESVADGLHVNDSVSAERGVIRAGGSSWFETSGADTWRPEPVPVTWRLESLNDGLSYLQRHASERAPADGLGRLIREQVPSDETSLVIDAARGPLSRLDQWLYPVLRGDSSAAHAEPRAIESLLGLGLGLTPSGDDFLVGTMVALHAIGRAEIADAIGDIVHRLGPASTTVISRAHLDAARRGQASAPIHSVVSALLLGDGPALERAISEVDGLGHTSGWDTLAGVGWVLTAVRASGGRRPRAA